MKLFELDPFAWQQRQMTCAYFDVMMDAESAGYPWPPSIRELADRMAAAMKQLNEAVGAALMPAIERISAIMGNCMNNHPELEELIKQERLRRKWGVLYPLVKKLEALG